MEALPFREAAVIGGGIAGLAAAHELQARGCGNVVLYDQYPPYEMFRAQNTSMASGAQFLPYVHHDMEPKFERDMLTLARETREVYKGFAASPIVTGVMPVCNVELIRSDHPWPAGLADFMDAKPRPLELPLTLTGADGEPCMYDSYYEFDTFSLNSHVLLHYLRCAFLQKGGRFVARGFDRQALKEQRVPTIQAAGVGALELAQDTDDKCQLVKGYTVRYQPEETIPPVAISVDDLLLMPLSDGTLVTGALYLDKLEDSRGEAAELKELYERIGQLAACAADSFRPLHPSWKKHAFPARAGMRVVSPQGPIIRQDLDNPQVVHSYGYGSVGYSTAFGGAKKAVDLLCRAVAGAG